ncbi:HNH endonuclease signature motif containing protein [Microbacterium sp. BH-3-3-3]|uniref:HNH endonuclease signature motif containing protein n=1 Tax=Microbacterium sp. BH-3-3-3 TaxID=1906742 RepID=UPI0011A4EF72|nr:HNH endonuclease signature motif containing protein [Microbacterium sp. BH-3-3-3]
MEVSAPVDRLRVASERVVGLIAGRELSALDDREIVGVMAEITAALNALDVLAACAARVIDARSARELGGAGLAQRQGHRNATELLQTLTGRSRREVTRSVKTGGDLLDAVGVVGDDGPRDTASPVSSAGGEWLERAGGALRDGALSHAQFQAIRVGLGEPPVERYSELDPDFLPRAWVAAVERLIAEAPHLPVEELRASARIARDRLDPVGVTLRFEERFAARSYRSWVDEHGQRHGRFVFDDDAAAWVDAILQAALRPRRGPRFVDPDAVVADAPDERSGEQIAYDTLMAVMRTGAAADPAQAFGDRQPGVRIVLEASALVEAPSLVEGESPGAEAMGVVTTVRGVGHLEDGGSALPGGVVESYLCDAGAVPVSVGDAGRPLDVGRHQRLFTRAQRIAIAVRDGGCVGIGCRAPISQCEMHHIDHWAADRGRTDVDDGVPLCRNHHLGLHNRGEKIVRERDSVTGRDSYWLHAPPDPRTGEVRPPTLLRSRSPRRFDAA